MATLKQDGPQVVERTAEGIAVTRHFEDGSMRITLHRPDGTVSIGTVRHNASTGAKESTFQRADGTVTQEIELPNGDRTVIEIRTDGTELRTEQSTDDDGNPTTRITHPDGGVETAVVWTDDRGHTHIDQTFPDGTSRHTEESSFTTPEGQTHTTNVVLDGDGNLIHRTDTETRPDGSSVTTLRDGPGANHTISTTYTSTMPDGAVRQRVVHDDGTDETFISREYDKDGNHIIEVQGEDSVHLTTVGKTFRSETVTYDDGTFEGHDETRDPDGSVTVTTTQRDGTWESTKQMPGEPPRTVTTRSDGVSIEQTFDGERMITIERRPDGTRLETRLDGDGVGSTGVFDAQGNIVTITTHDGEPLEARSTLDGDDDATMPTGVVTPEHAEGAVAEGSQGDDSVLTDPFGSGGEGDGDGTAVEDLVAGSAADATPPPDDILTPRETEIDEAGDTTDFTEEVDVEFDVAGDTTQVTEEIDLSEKPPPDREVEYEVDVSADPALPDEELDIVDYAEPVNLSEEVEVTDYTEVINVSYPETESGIGPDPDVPMESPDESPFESPEAW